MMNRCLWSDVGDEHFLQLKASPTAAQQQYAVDGLLAPLGYLHPKGADLPPWL